MFTLSDCSYRFVCYQKTGSKQKIPKVFNWSCNVVPLEANASIKEELPVSLVRCFSDAMIGPISSRIICLALCVEICDPPVLHRAHAA
jgi:hypothetical protein